MTEKTEDAHDQMHRAFQSQPGDEDYVEPVEEKFDPIFAVRKKEPEPEPDKIVNEIDMTGWTNEEKASHRQNENWHQTFETKERTAKRAEQGEELNASLDERNDEADHEYDEELAEKTWYEENPLTVTYADQMEVLAQPQFLGKIGENPNFTANDHLALATLLHNADHEPDPRHRMLFDEVFDLMVNQGLNALEAEEVLSHFDSPDMQAPRTADYALPGGPHDNGLNRLTAPTLKKNVEVFNA